MKRAGTDLRLATRDNGAFELPMLPGASACAFRFRLPPPKKSPTLAGPYLAVAVAVAVFLFVSFHPLLLRESSFRPSRCTR